MDIEGRSAVSVSVEGYRRRRDAARYSLTVPETAAVRVRRGVRCGRLGDEDFGAVVGFLRR
jgi:hypothetical protein